MARLWHIEMLGELRVVGADRVITRFRSRQTGALLAYLAFYLDRAHPRELLMEAIWPGEEIESARDRLRVALSSLRRQLEPPGVLAGTVILAGRRTAQLNPAAVSTDVAAFETALHVARGATDAGERARWLPEAIERYRGELLPGYYEAWIVPERQRLADLHSQAARELIQDREQAGDFSGALDLAGRAVAADSLREEAHQELIRLYLRTGQPVRAQQQFRELERLLQQELGEAPTLATQELLTGSEPWEDASLRKRLDAAASTGEKEPSSSSHSPVPSPSPASPLLPPRGTLTVGTNHLPLQPTRFIGREAEIAALLELLGSPPAALETQSAQRKSEQEEETPHSDPVPLCVNSAADGEFRRLVTLTGPGGSGKTRLAIEVAGRLVEARHGAVWWVPLVDLADPGLMADEVRDAMRLPRSPQVPALEQVVEALTERGQPALLVLDNLEHLIDGGAALVRELLERVPALQCLVTSRLLLNLAGEREFRVDPLPVPVKGSWLIVDGSAGAGLSAPSTINHQPSTLTQYDSVRLFVDRAQAVRPDFQVTNHNAPAVAELCHRLEGIPLAIELAAARTRLLTPAQMRRMLNRRFDLLVSHRRDLPTRHQTLRAALDWSYRLLSPEHQRLFSRLFVFRGGWTVEAAAAICGDGGAGDALALDVLAQLHDSSLVIAEAGGPERRSRMLETLREYAAEQLTPEEREDVARRHADYFLAFAEAAEPEIHGKRDKETQEGLEREHDNLRSALDWFVGHRLVSEALRLGAALFLFWHARHHWAEGQRRLIELLNLTDPSDHSRERGRALEGAGRLAWRRQEFDVARPLLEQCLPIHRAHGDWYGSSVALGLLGHIAAAEAGGLTRARELYEEVIHLLEEKGDRGGVAEVYLSLGTAAAAQGDIKTARRLWEQRLEIFRDLSNLRDLGWASEGVVDLAYRRGDYAAACAYLEERWQTRLAIARERGVALQSDRELAPDDRPPDGRGVCRLLEVCLAMEQELEIDWKHWAAWRRLQFARMLIQQSDFPAARAVLDECTAVFRRLGQKDDLARSLHALGTVARRQGRYGEATEAFEEGLTVTRAHRLGRSAPDLMIGLAMTASDQGGHSQARPLLEEGLALTRGLGQGVSLPLALAALSTLLRRQGDFVAARACLDESLKRSEKLEDCGAVGLALAGLGQLSLAEGAPATAEPLLRQSLSIRWLRGDPLGVAECLEGLAAVAGRLPAGRDGMLERAARLLGAAAVLREKTGAPLPLPEAADQKRCLASLRAALGDEALDNACFEGRRLNLENVVKEAMNPDPLV